jgi:hypothetical protein
VPRQFQGPMRIRRQALARHFFRYYGLCSTRSLPLWREFLFLGFLCVGRAEPAQNAGRAPFVIPADTGKVDAAWSDGQDLLVFLSREEILLSPRRGTPQRIPMPAALNDGALTGAGVGGRAALVAWSRSNTADPPT